MKGYLSRIRSSRRLEAETHRNLEVTWLLLRPQADFKTNRGLPARQSGCVPGGVSPVHAIVCRELDLYGRELIAVDGTRIKAVNNRERNFTRAKLNTHLQRIDNRHDRYPRHETAIL